MEKIINVIKVPLVIVLTLILQIFISNKFALFGITPDLILVTVVILSLWNKMTVNLIGAAFMGIVSDLIFNFDFGKSFVIYIMVALLITTISKKYRKESKTTIIYMTIIATVVATFLKLIYLLIANMTFVSIFAILKQMIVEILLNIAISWVVYKLFEKNMKDDILR